MNKKAFSKLFAIFVLAALIFGAVGIGTPVHAATSMPVTVAQPLLCPDGSIVFGSTTCKSYRPEPMYVKPDNETNLNGDCLSWADSCTLQHAIALVTLWDMNAYPQIYVKAGTYRPTSTTDRTISFALNSHTNLVGGYAGTDLTRDPAKYETILSGDIGVQGVNTDNSMHVVTISGYGYLSGFTVRDGYTDFLDNPQPKGGGILISTGHPALFQLKITNNYAGYGGGMAWFNDYAGVPTDDNVNLSQTDFIDNTAIVYGGGLFSSGNQMDMTDVTFTGNAVLNGNYLGAAHAGGAIAMVLGGLQATHVTMVGNHAPGIAVAGGIWAGTIGGSGNISSWFANSVMANNEGGDCLKNALTDFSTASNNNIIDDSNTACGLQDGVLGNQVGHPYLPPPVLSSAAVSTATVAGSGIDAGSNATCAPIDQQGRPRPYGPRCDIGATEYSPVYYVSPAGLTKGSCDSWLHACKLQYALSRARTGTALWVMAGTYKPSAADRSKSFVLKSGVPVYGGFAGTETLLSQRNPALHVTILSGDIGTVGVATDNSYHVVVGSNADSTAILDGFTITAGRADGVDWPDYNGGGMLNYTGNPTLNNLTFLNNYAANGGGGLINDTNSNVSLTNSTFSGNSAGVDNTSAGGGGVLNWIASNISLASITFANNTTTGPGGGLVNYSTSTNLNNVTFSGNSAGTFGGGLKNISGTVTMKNSIVAGSTSGGDCSGSLGGTPANNLVQDGSNACGLTNGTNGNQVGVDPMLSPLAANGGSTKTVALLAGSPAIDAGSNATCALTDQRGFPRPQDGNNDAVSTCDIGAYELLPTATYLSNGAEDGWVLESSETSSLGGTLNKLSTTLRLGDDVANKQYRSILSFGTGALPDTAKVAFVTLRLKKQGVTGALNPLSTFSGLSVDVKKGTFGLAALAAGDFQAAGKHLSLPTPVLSGGWYQLNLTKVAASINNPLADSSALTQLRLEFNLDDNNDFAANYLSLYSGNSDPANAPQLIVQYYLP